MKDLVTTAAIDAVMRWLPNFITYTDDGLERARYTTRRNLETAAPLIAAEALRRASNEPLRQTLNVVDAQESWRLMLRRLADELEADAAFTGMVQLGQEIEATNTEEESNG